MTLRRIGVLIYRLFPIPVVALSLLSFGGIMVGSLEGFGIDHPALRWAILLGVCSIMISVIKALITAPDPFDPFSSWKLGEKPEQESGAQEVPAAS